VLAQEAASRARRADKHNEEVKLYRLANLDRVKAYLKRYWQEHLDKAREYRSRRRAAKRNAGGDHTAEDIADIRRMQRDRCANPKCRCKLNGGGAVDHIRALANDGTNDRRNLQLLCKSCNSRKRSKDAIIFMQEQGLLL
jgi:5-methylcytosine-specific restriction endonuclease McrA